MTIVGIIRDGKFVLTGHAAPRQRKAHNLMSDLPGYKSPLGDGKWIEGRSARREHMKRHGVREVDPSEYKPQYLNPKYAHLNRER